MVLVTGATGNHGSTGMRLARRLIKNNIEVKALVRSEDDRAKKLNDMGCQTVVGDFFDISSLRDALKGVDTLYFSYPIKEGISFATANIAYVAKEFRLHRIVHNSMIPTMELSPSPFARESFMTEQIFKWANIPTVNLHSGFFFENLLRYSKEEIIENGKISWPLGDGNTKMAWISAEDVAEAASVICMNPEKQFDEIIRLTGPEALTFNEVASVCSEVMNQQVVYKDSEESTFLDKVKEIEGADSLVVPHLKGLSYSFKQGKSFGRTTHNLERLTGSSGQSLQEFLKHYLA